jgi:hypothetical protein
MPTTPANSARGTGNKKVAASQIQIKVNGSSTLQPDSSFGHVGGGAMMEF